MSLTVESNWPTWMENAYMTLGCLLEVFGPLFVQTSSKSCLLNVTSMCFLLLDPVSYMSSPLFLLSLAKKRK